MSLITSLQPLLPLPPLPPIPEPVPVGEEPEEVFPSVPELIPVWLELGYLLVEWLAENVLVPVVEEIVEAIDFLEAEVAAAMHEVYLFLAEVYETDLGFLLITIGTMVLSIYLPQLTDWFNETSIGQVLARLQDWMGEGFGRILELMSFVDLVAISEIMTVVWPLWRDLMSQLSAAISGLAGELAEGTGYIHAWVSVVYGLVLTSNSLLGIDSKVSAVEALEKSEEFTRNVSENFRRYAHDPGLIVSDIIETYYIPYATRIKDGQLSLIQSITDNRDEATGLVDDLQVLNDSVDHWIAIQPEETATIVEEKFGPLSESLDSFIDGFNLIVLPGINGTLAALETRADRIEAANKSAAEKIDNPFYSITMYELMSENRQAAYEHIIAYMAGQESSKAENALRPVSLAATTLFTDLLVTGAAEHQLLPILKLEPITTRPISAYLSVSRSSWFVGDY